MEYNLEEISKLSKEIALYSIYNREGNGVMEDPSREGNTIKTLLCSEIDAFIISEAINIERYGIISKRSSWETPKATYKKLKVE